MHACRPRPIIGAWTIAASSTDRGRPHRELGRGPRENGVDAIEAYLAKHLAFLTYLDESSVERRSAEAYASASPSAFSSEPFGIAPMADASGSPFSNRTMNGIDATP